MSPLQESAIPPESDLFENPLPQVRMSYNRYAFSWETTPLAWPARLGAWNPRSENYRTPVPCKHGMNCLFTGVCSFVHPGEEGTGLKLFPGRSYLSEDGTECWEPAVVRLIGGARYYERRRLRLSWSAWCERVGLPLPQRPSGRRQQRLDLSSPAPQVEIVGEDSFTATAEDEQRAAWAAFYAQQAAYQQRQPTEAELKTQLGDALFPLIQQNLADTAADRETIGFCGPLFTAGKFTGMLLEGCSVDELRQLVAGGAGSAELCELMLEGCEVLAAAQKPQVTVEIRPAAQVKTVTGATAVANCAHDSVAEIYEDLAREAAGLPPLERPPSITSYETQPDGTVRVVKTVYPLEPVKRDDLRRKAMKNAQAARA